MQVEAFGRFFEIPETMIREFMNEFNGIAQPGNREDLEEIRDTTTIVLLMMHEEPDLLEDKEYEHDFIKAHAMRQALHNYGVLFDA